MRLIRRRNNPRYTDPDCLPTKGTRAMRLRLTLLSVFLLTYATLCEASSVSDCARVKSHAGAWVGRSVDSLVRAAFAAYEDEDALPAYRRVLRRITRTLERCGLSLDEEFVEQRREFVEYVGAASLDAMPDHELGFVVPDAQYFEETRDLVAVPDFLTTRAFLRAVSSYRTLARAKSYLRRLNGERSPDDKLVFFSYESRHLGTPDNEDSYGRLLIVVPGDASRG